VHQFAGRTAIVTGGTGALGSAVALQLLAGGARVAVTYRSDREWEQLQGRAKGQLDGERAANLVGARVDLTQAAEIGEFVGQSRERWGRIDFLAAVAGGFAAGRSFETDEQTWDAQFHINLKSLFLTLHAVLPVMIQQNFGRIVTVSSGSILRGGGAGIAAYAVSKGAARQLTEIVADEVREFDIHVHCIMPGTMDTEANRRAMPQADFSHWVKTEDVAGVICYLMSDEAKALRSATVPVLG
jgi:NAD(P)-dependent dehydrogenase (short-subunit alcohol dehydrogenase family)